jgi:NAD(P)-dependent dehydrogenase (short-subunit alcohol dehydrogenase family)
MQPDFEALAPGRARSRLLDVRDAEAVKAVVADVGSIDVLVNNAGYGLVGAVEEVTLSQSRDQLEVNFFGALSMIQAVLPGMRRRRSGHILNITSIGGLLAFPGLGLYHASKFALEGLSEALAKEVAPFDIRVTAIEPGAFRTDWAGRSMQHATQLPDYAMTAGAFRSGITASSGRQPGDPRKAAQAIVDLAFSSHPPTRLLLGSDALGYATEKLDSVRADIEAWASVTRSTDF